jgi:hypothetical protein
MGILQSDSLKTDASSVRGITLVIVMIIGKMLLIFSLFYLAAHAAFGTPCVVPVAIAGGAVGLACVILTSKISGNSWADSVTQAPHYSAAIAAIPFLLVVIRRMNQYHRVDFFPAGILALFALMALVTWWLRTRKKA